MREGGREGGREDGTREGRDTESVSVSDIYIPASSEEGVGVVSSVFSLAINQSASLRASSVWLYTSPYSQASLERTAQS